MAHIHQFDWGIAFALGDSSGFPLNFCSGVPSVFASRIFLSCSSVSFLIEIVDALDATAGLELRFSRIATMLCQLNLMPLHAY